jgi:hypothetical protein
LIPLLIRSLTGAPIQETSIDLLEAHNNPVVGVQNGQTQFAQIIISANYDDIENDNDADMVLAESQIFRPLFSYKSQNARRIRLKRSSGVLLI